MNVKKTRKGTPWVKVDIDTFPEELNALYEEFLDARKASKSAWKAFETDAKRHVTRSKDVPEGKVPAFNYNGNALQIAFIDPKTIGDKELFSFQNGPVVEPEPSSPNPEPSNPEAASPHKSMLPSRRPKHLFDKSGE